MRALGLVLSLVVACSRGSEGDASSSAPDAGSSDSGTNPSTSDSGTSGDTGDAGPCPAFRIGAQDDDAIGGSAKSRVEAQSIADITSALDRQIEDLTTSCKQLAVGLNASAASQASAAAPTDPALKAKAWCDLAALSIDTAKNKVGPSVSLTTAPVACKLAVNTKIACQARCSDTGACDLATNPVQCTGGTLAGGYCEGGTLEGGCLIDATCDRACDLTVAAEAVCNPPAVSTTVPIGVDPTTAAILKTALEANLPALLALRARFNVESALQTSFSAITDAASDIAPACILPVKAAAVRAGSELGVGSTSANDVLMHVGD